MMKHEHYDHALLLEPKMSSSSSYDLIRKVDIVIYLSF